MVWLDFVIVVLFDLRLVVIGVRVVIVVLLGLFYLGVVNHCLFYLIGLRLGLCHPLVVAVVLLIPLVVGL